MGQHSVTCWWDIMPPQLNNKPLSSQCIGLTKRFKMTLCLLLEKNGPTKTIGIIFSMESCLHTWSTCTPTPISLHSNCFMEGNQPIRSTLTHWRIEIMILSHSMIMWPLLTGCAKGWWSRHTPTYQGHNPHKSPIMTRNWSMITHFQ